MTRTEAAKAIAKVVGGEYDTSVWAPEGDSGPVRVYVTIPAPNWKKKAQAIGYIAVSLDGTVESELSRQSGTIMSMLPDMEITPAAAKAIPARQAVAVDEDVAAFEASERRVGAAEQAREIG